MNELKSMVLFLMDKTDNDNSIEKEKEIKMPVLNSSDLQLVFKGGYEEVIQAHIWPFQTRKKQLYQGDHLMTEEEVQSFFNGMFKQIEELFMNHVSINQWMNHDPLGKFPMYSLKVYDKNIKKLKPILISHCK
jgi:hypothetical protein